MPAGDTTSQPTNPVARYEDGVGGYVEILEPGDETAPLRYRMRQSPGVGPPAAEFHPHQAESFLVLDGALDLGVIDGERVIVQEGERYELAAGTPHLPRAANGQAAEYEATLTPGLDMADVFEALFRYEREHRGFGKVLRIALTLTHYQDTMRLTQPLWSVLKALAVAAKVSGVRP